MAKPSAALAEAERRQMEPVEDVPQALPQKMRKAAGGGLAELEPHRRRGSGQDLHPVAVAQGLVAVAKKKKKR